MSSPLDFDFCDDDPIHQQRETRAATTTTSPQQQENYEDRLDPLKNPDCLPYHNPVTFCGGTLRMTSTGRYAAYTRDDFEFGPLCGEGKFGKVYIVRERKTGLLCAMKVLQKSQLMRYQNFKYQFAREVEIQMNLRHPHIVRLFGYFYTAAEVYLILEYSGTQLYEDIQNVSKENQKRRQNNKCYDAKTCASYILQLSSAVEYLHAKNILHRDIKPENILIAPGNTLKLADFGWSVHTVEKRKTFCGTPEYLAPEIVSRREYDRGVDIWALGCLLYEMFVGHNPFENVGPLQRSQQDMYKHIEQARIIFPPTIPPDAQTLIRQLLAKDPTQRYDLGKLRYEPFIIRMLSEEERQLNDCDRLVVQLRQEQALWLQDYEKHREQFEYEESQRKQLHEQQQEMVQKENALKMQQQEQQQLQKQQQQQQQQQQQLQKQQQHQTQTQTITTTTSAVGTSKIPRPYPQSALLASQTNNNNTTTNQLRPHVPPTTLNPKPLQPSKLQPTAQGGGLLSGFHRPAGATTATTKPPLRPTTRQSQRRVSRRPTHRAPIQNPTTTITSLATGATTATTTTTSSTTTATPTKYTPKKIIAPSSSTKKTVFTKALNTNTAYSGGIGGFDNSKFASINVSSAVSPLRANHKMARQQREIPTTPSLFGVQSQEHKVQLNHSFMDLSFDP